MIKGTRSIRFATLRLTAATSVIGLAIIAVTVLPEASANAARSTSVPSTPLGALLAKLHDPAANGGDQFGIRVAVSETTAVIGAPDPGSFTNAGTAYIYVKGATGWPKKPTATLPDPASTPGDGGEGLAS